MHISRRLVAAFVVECSLIDYQSAFTLIKCTLRRSLLLLLLLLVEQIRLSQSPKQEARTEIVARWSLSRSLYLSIYLYLSLLWCHLRALAVASS